MTRRLAHDEQGVALVLAICIMLVLSLTTVAMVTASALNHRTTLKSAEATKAFNLAQLGLAYAEGRVYSAASTHTTPLVGQTSFTQDGGSGTYAATVAGDGHTWTMTGTGTVDGITRTVNATANVPSASTIQDAGVWNYLYADKVTNDGSCPTTIGGSSNTIISVPVLVRGNICITAAFTGAQLEAGGNLTVSGANGRIGSSASPISTLRVHQNCQAVTPGTGVCDGHHSPIYASSVSQSLSVNATMPPLDLPTNYTTTNPGPGSGHGCQVGSGVPSPFFDNNSTLDDSVASVNLFPATSYDCHNGAYSLVWNASSQTLTVNGTFYFDGNLSVSGNSHIVYQGSGTLYFTGTIHAAGGFSLCGIQNCTTSWNTDVTATPPGNAIVLVAGCWANSTGALVRFAATGTYCVDYGGSNTMQVGTYCATDYHISGNSTNMGPVLADTLSLGGSASTLIPFHVMPPGTPLNTSTSYLPASSPTNWNG